MADDIVERTVNNGKRRDMAWRDIPAGLVADRQTVPAGRQTDSAFCRQTDR